MVYDWDGKRDVCYDLYIVQRQSLEEIMVHMRDMYAFTPSKRAFQTQFKRWGFPSKQNPAHRNLNLVDRVRQLWESNTSQRDMLRILNDEGYDIKERELMRVRAKNRWLLRVPNGTKSQGIPDLNPDSPQPNHGSEEAAEEPATQPAAVTEPAFPSSSDPGPDVLAKRKVRREEMQKESDERYATRKRRRRTRGWGGLPADPPGPPRFPSETTIEESKRLLNLDNAHYREMRDYFQKICEDNRVIKKTLAGPDRWQAVKTQLIDEYAHLHSVFWTDQTKLDAKALALDVICTDVTKRMRTLESRMTIAEAKNTLGINPEESRQIRNLFYGTLRADHFTSKLEAGEEHWKQLKEQWIQNSALLRSIISAGSADPNYSTKMKAIEVLCRDVMKRLRDDQAKRDSNRKDANDSGLASSSPSAVTPARAPMPAKVRNTRNTAGKSKAAATDTSNAKPLSSKSADASIIASKALASTPLIISDVSDLQIDPSLLAAATIPSPSSTANNNINPDTAVIAASPIPPRPLPPPFTLPITLRLHPNSPLSPPFSDPTSELSGRLSARTITDLKAQAIEVLGVDRSRNEQQQQPNDSDDNGAPLGKNPIEVEIDGVEKVVNGGGKEISWRITADEELVAYLEHMKGKMPLFVCGFR
ncbi:MAG: hypothetical protein Q9160_005044 [Pyrenula sp. 1 TL-2023]